VRWLVVFAVVTLPAWLLLGGWFVLQFNASQAPTGDQIAYEAHVGGFLAGIVLLLLPVLGWKEHVELPEWGLRLRGKLDTGARSSALHVTEPRGGRESTTRRRARAAGRALRRRARAGATPPSTTRSRPPSSATSVVRDTGARAETAPSCGPASCAAPST
jgi:hypothetical protein